MSRYTDEELKQFYSREPGCNDIIKPIKATLASCQVDDKELEWLRRLNSAYQQALRDRNLYVESLYHRYKVDPKQFNFELNTGKFLSKDDGKQD